MVGVDTSSLQVDLQPSRLACFKAGQPCGAVLHSSNESCELMHKHSPDHYNNCYYYYRYYTVLSSCTVPSSKPVDKSALG